MRHNAVGQSGSHVILTKPGSQVTLSIPDHAQVARGTLRALMAKRGCALRCMPAYASFLAVDVGGGMKSPYTNFPLAFASLCDVI
ncbi:MAG: type II toxin-antitoxin system HicA family toxin [Bryobacterales bacterium]|nr:type II toxin-antitoxin system HicA family toxin [Bryobacterales bacterium]MBV9401259.1 type II toxin-antitoxin system HicA family toxin [Bryobacterales bacterium]